MGYGPSLYATRCHRKRPFVASPAECVQWILSTFPQVMLRKEGRSATATTLMTLPAGLLLQGGSVAAARADDRSSVQSFLNVADETTRPLDHDSNHLWTAFGPTNVSIHRVTTAMDLGDVQLAIDLGPRVDTSALPIERQVRHALETARALSARNLTEEALAAVLAAGNKRHRTGSTPCDQPAVGPDLDAAWPRTSKLPACRTRAAGTRRNVEP
jgi:hypothetical protein